MNLPLKHIYLFINDNLKFDYYMTNDLKNYLSEKEAKNLPCTQMVVNYNLHSKDEVCIRKCCYLDAIYYEINFELAYKHIYDLPVNNYTASEHHFLQFVRLLKKDNPREFISFLSKTKSFSQQKLLTNEKNYSKIKNYFYKKRLMQKPVNL